MDEEPSGDFSRAESLILLQTGFSAGPGVEVMEKVGELPPVPSDGTFRGCAVIPVHHPCSYGSAGCQLMSPCPCFGGEDHLIPSFSHFSGAKSYWDNDDKEEQPPSMQLPHPLPQSWGTSEASWFTQPHLQMFLKFLVDLIHRDRKKRQTPFLCLQSCVIFIS